MIIAIGEVLYDVFPDAKRVGGAPFNFAFHLIQMGYPVKFITRVGADRDGEQLLAFMERSGFDREYVQVDEVHKTGRVMVYPDHAGIPRFDIVQDAAYDHLVWTDAVQALLSEPPAMLYFGTLIQRAPVSGRFLWNIFQARLPETLLFCDINLRPDCYTRDIVRDSLHHADILKLNDEELDAIRKMFGYSGDAASVAAELIRDYALTLVALTRGSRGSEIFTAADHVKMPACSGYECVDTVGAGDAFAAVIAAGILKKMDIRRILTTAADFSGRICGIPGAVPDRMGFYNALNM